MKSDTLKRLPHGTWTCLLLPELISAGRLGAAVACFANEACLLTPDATGIHGRDRIRPVLAQLIALRPQIEVELRNVLVAGDVAFSRERWTIRTGGIEGSQFEQTSNPTLVMRWIEGQWKLVIAAPWDWGK